MLGLTVQAEKNLRYGCLFETSMYSFCFNNAFQIDCGKHIFHLRFLLDTETCHWHICHTMLLPPQKTCCISILLGFVHPGSGTSGTVLMPRKSSLKTPCVGKLSQGWHRGGKPPFVCRELVRFSISQSQITLAYHINELQAYIPFHTEQL